MKRTSITLPDDLDTRLVYEARRRGLSTAALAREAIAAYLASDADGVPSFVGLGAGGAGTVSEDVDEHVGRIVDARYERRSG